MNKNKRFFTLSMPMILALCSLFTITDTADAARVATRGTAVARKTVSNTTQTQSVTTNENVTVEPVVENEPIIENKASQFSDSISASGVASSDKDDMFAESIRKQRAALAASDAANASETAQKQSLASNTSACDMALRRCMQSTCGNDFTKCAKDGDTIFGDKLNKCRKDTKCSGEEFNLFTTEIKDDRDMNVRLLSYDSVINCGNNYNACIATECGATFNKCLGKQYADAAIQKCASVANDCKEADSGLASRVGNAIGKLRENAEKEVKKDEERLYALRDLMSKQCKSLGATFDERSFDCIYTIEFFAGENQNTPTASRKRYAGDTFVCMQEWFGINATTFKENAYRETRSQTAASSAMLGSGLGTAAGLISSGAIDRALTTQKAKKDLKEECKQSGGTFKNGKCITDTNKNPDAVTPTPTSISEIGDDDEQYDNAYGKHLAEEAIQKELNKGPEPLKNEDVRETETITLEHQDGTKVDIEIFTDDEMQKMSDELVAAENDRLAQEETEAQ